MMLDLTKMLPISQKDGEKKNAQKPQRVHSEKYSLTHRMLQKMSPKNVTKSCRAAVDGSDEEIVAP